MIDKKYAAKLKKYFSFSLFVIFMLFNEASAGDNLPLRLVQKIPMPNVLGRIDHMAVDIKGGRLFVAALGNNTLEVIDVKEGKHTQSIKGFKEPQGIMYIPETGEVLVANGGNGLVSMLDGRTFNIVKTTKLSGDADNIRYNAGRNEFYVGYGNGAISVFDSRNNGLVSEIKLSGHPESFQVEKDGGKIFVNVPTAKHIAIIDLEKKMMIKALTFPDALSNYPMALDEKSHMLFVGFRKPSLLVIFNAESGKTVSAIKTSGDADDIFYDLSHKRVYVSAGEGFVNVFEEKEGGGYKMTAKIPTASGARTSLFAPELNRLFLAVPHKGTQEGEIWVYEVLP